MKRYKAIYVTSQINREVNDEGKSIEQNIRECIANAQPIEGHAPMIYTEKKDGVLPQYDIRADRQEIALDAIDKVEKIRLAKKDENPTNQLKTNEE